MPTLSEARQRADTWLAGLWAQIQIRQENYRSSHGGYFQGKWTHSAPPSHTQAQFNDSVSDRLGDFPSDQDWSWLEFYPELEDIPIPCRISITTYGGPQGQGYVATVDVIFRGNHYSRSQNHGPETWRTVGWHKVEEVDI